MNITVQIDEVTLATAVEQTYRQVDEDEWRPDGHVTVGEMVARLIVDKFVSDYDGMRAFRERVSRIRDEVIRAAVEPAVAEALLAPVQQTTAFGDPVGEPTTLRDLIVKEARAILKGPGTRNSYSSEKFLDELIRTQVRDALTKEVADVVKTAKAAVTAEMGKEVAKQITAAVTAGMVGR